MFFELIKSVIFELIKTVTEKNSLAGFFFWELQIFFAMASKSVSE